MASATGSTGKDSGAQDLTQDVFLRVYRTLGSFLVERRVVHHLAGAPGP